MAKTSILQDDDATNDVTNSNKYITTKSATISSAGATSFQMQKIITVTETVVEQQEHNTSKSDGEFLLRSRMNENFRKASAFWKAT